MTNNRLSETEEKLSMLQEQLDGMEKIRITAPAEERTRINQRIRTEIMPEIRRYEEEYWRIIENQSESLQISESDANTIVAEIVNEVDKIEISQLADHSDEAMQILREIQNKLNQPESSAVGKVKGMISSIPAFYWGVLRGRPGHKSFSSQGGRFS